MEQEKPKITRLMFLKTSAATAAAIAAGDRLLSKPAALVAEQPSPAGLAQQEDTWIHTYCKMCIGPICGLLVHRQNRVVVGIRGDPDHPANQGALCPRGNSNIGNLYNPYRVKAPMKRTNPEKGLDIDPKWVEITWDEALDILTQKLGDILKTDPRQFVAVGGFGSMRDDSPMWRPVFPAAFGTPNTPQVNGPLCPVHYGALAGLGSFTYSVDLARCNYLVSLGANYGGDFTRASVQCGGHSVSSWYLMDAIDRGMKLVVVNPHAGGDAKRAEWVPIKAGTDLAMLLTLSHVILHELNRYDEMFLTTRTNLPYLIRPDGSYARDTASSKPLLWDLEAGKALPFDDPTLTKPALSGTFSANGETVQTAFDLLKEHLGQYTPEWAEGVTTVPAADIRRITTELVEAAKIGSTIQLDGFTFPYRPAAVHSGRGAISHRGGANVMLATNIVNALIGSLDVPGGLTGERSAPFLQPGADGTVEPSPRLVPQANEWIYNEWHFPPDSLDLAEFYPHKHSTPFVAWRAIANPDKYYIKYEPKAMMVYGANPFMNSVAPEEPAAAFEKVPFVCCIAYQFDEPTQFADLLLPESSNMERLNYFEYESADAATGRRGLVGMNVRAPVVDPIYNTRDANSVLIDLGNRLGLTPKMNAILSRAMGFPQDGGLVPVKPYTWPEVLDLFLKTRFGQDKSVDYFVQQGSAWTAKFLSEKETYNYFYFPAGATRHPIWDEHLRASGERMAKLCAENGVSVPGWKMDEYLAYFQALPVWIPHQEHLAPAEFDLYAVNWKIGGRAFGMGGVEEIPWLREIEHLFDPTVDVILINSQTAANKGLQEGDKIICESQYGGRVDGIAHLTELIHLSGVGFAGNFGHVAPLMGAPAREGLNYNRLLSADDGIFDPVIGAIDATPAVKVYKA
jgi:anaerobic selenocysteine-containing dehydrogenase